MEKTKTVVSGRAVGIQVQGQHGFVQKIGRVVLLAVVGLGIGCMPTLSHQVRYSGGQFSAPTQYASINIIRSGTPDGDFVAMGTVEVECPTAVGGRLFMQGLDQTEGGCTFEEASTLAQQKAAEVGADGIFDIKTGVAANGRIASLLATTYKQQSVARIR